MRRMQCKCGEVELSVDAEPIASTACFCGDCLGSIETIEGLGGDGYRNEYGGQAVSLVYSDSIRIVRGAERIAAFYQRKPSGLRLYTTCCKVPIGNYMGALKVDMLNTVLLDPAGEWPVLQVDTADLPADRRAAIEGGYKKAPLSFAFRFMSAAFSPFNGHKKKQWVPDSMLVDVPSSRDLLD